MSHHWYATGGCEPPEGSRFLDAVSDFCQSAVLQSDAVLSHDLRRMRDTFGTVISLLDQASSCYWGCGGGDHAAEYLVGRCCGYAMGAYALTRSAFYDESLSLARTIGEMANICYLFAAIPTKLDEWRTLSDDVRRKTYSPVKVRLSLEEAKLPVPVDQHRYGQLCEKATHPSPRIPPGMYNQARHPRAAGEFQPVGLAVCLHEIAFPLMIVGTCTSELLGVQDNHRKRVDGAASSLGAVLPELRLYANALFPGTYA
jgi:hypothetical protein